LPADSFTPSEGPQARVTSEAGDSLAKPFELQGVEIIESGRFDRLCREVEEPEVNPHGTLVAGIEGDALRLAVRFDEPAQGFAFTLITFQPRACCYAMTASTAIRWTSSSRSMAATFGSERSGCGMTHALFSRDWSPLNSPGMFCPRNCDDTEGRGRTGIEGGKTGTGNQLPTAQLEPVPVLHRRRR